MSFYNEMMVLAHLYMMFLGNAKKKQTHMHNPHQQVMIKIITLIM